jgi:Ni/Fe-hydrogenase subunit HybB-like protein
MATTRFHTIEGKGRGYFVLMGMLGLVTLIGLYAAHYVEVHGHVVTGMDNHVVWGMPHVFAIFLIVAASGALNVASLGSVFGRSEYKSLGRLSALLAIALLIGGLVILVLDLGRPDRLIVAMTTYNFKSIFAWNIFLYTGFIAIVAVYLWMMFELRMNRYAKVAGTVAFGWRIILTTGTGSIFGFLVARQAYDAAIMAPLFVLMSLSFGTAVFLLVVAAISRGTGRVLSADLVARLRRLLGLFVMAVLYLVAVYHLTNLYATENHGVQRFILLEGGIYTALFWLVQVFAGSVLPMVLLLAPGFEALRWTLIGAGLVIVGGFAQLYVIIVGGQAYPLSMFPGMEVSSQFLDGQVSSYAPTLPEVLLGLGGVSLALLITLIATRVLPFLPEVLGDKSPEAGVGAKA